MYGHVITKFSWMGRLLHFLTHGAPLARFARESSAINFDHFGSRLREGRLYINFRSALVQNTPVARRVKNCYGTYTVGVNIKREMVLSPNNEDVATTQNAKTGGRSREVVVYKNQTTGGLFREEVQAHRLYGR